MRIVLEYVNRNKSLIIIPVIFLIGYFLFSCSSPKETIKPTIKMSIPDLIKEINTNSEKIRSFKASGNLTVEAPNNANSGGFKLSLVKPDSVLIKITGPFGINAAKVLMTSDTFLFYNAFENAMVTGKTSDRNLGLLLNIKVDFDEIISLLSCIPDFHREGLTAIPSEYSIEDNEYILTYSKDEVVVKYWVNPDLKYITKRCVFNLKGKVLREERYQNYLKIGELQLPQSIKIILYNEKQSLALFYDTQEPNPHDLDLSFNLPDGIKIIHWR